MILQRQEDAVPRKESREAMFTGTHGRMPWRVGKESPRSNPGPSGRGFFASAWRREVKTYLHEGIDMSERVQRRTGATMLAAVLLGIGIMAALHEIGFHQVLAWHHFVETDNSALALASDGLLHTLELVMLVIGGALMLRLHETGQHAPGYRGAGFLLGMGGFQLFDGIVDHKILGLHQVRYVDNLLVYDLCWNLAGLLLLAIGYWLLRRARRGEALSQR